MRLNSAVRGRGWEESRPRCRFGHRVVAGEYRHRGSGRGAGRGKEAMVARTSTGVWCSGVVVMLLAARGFAQTPLAAEPTGAAAPQQARPAQVQGFLTS